MNNDEKLVLDNLYKLQNGTLNYLIVLSKVCKTTPPPETLGYLTKNYLFLYAELWMLCCRDIELNPGPEMFYEYFFKVSEMHKNNLRFDHLNLQTVSNKHILLQSYINDMGKNTIIGIDPSERDYSNLFDNSTFESLGVEWRSNFSKKFMSKILLNITYKLLKKYITDFLEQLMTILGNASCESFMGITLVGDYNLDYFAVLEKENLDTVVLAYGFTVASPCLPTRVCKSTKITLITY